MKSKKLTVQWFFPLFLKCCWITALKILNASWYLLSVPPLCSATLVGCFKSGKASIPLSQMPKLWPLPSWILQNPPHGFVWFWRTQDSRVIISLHGDWCLNFVFKYRKCAIWILHKQTNTHKGCTEFDQIPFWHLLLRSILNLPNSINVQYDKSILEIRLWTLGPVSHRSARAALFPTRHNQAIPRHWFWCIQSSYSWL